MHLYKFQVNGTICVLSQCCEVRLLGSLMNNRCIHKVLKPLGGNVSQCWFLTIPLPFSIFSVLQTCTQWVCSKNCINIHIHLLCVALMLLREL